MGKLDCVFIRDVRNNECDLGLPHPAEMASRARHPGTMEGEPNLRVDVDFQRWFEVHAHVYIHSDCGHTFCVPHSGRRGR